MIASLTRNDCLGRLGTLLRAVGYESHRLRALLKLKTSVDVILSDIARFSLYYLDTLSVVDDPTAVLFELYLLCGEVPEERWRRLNPELASVLTELELVECLPTSRRRGTVAITEYANRFFLSDRLFEHGPDGFTRNWPTDGCMPPHASSLELRRSIEKLYVPGGSFLDMGCGTGCQSQLLESGYPRRVGIDTSSRSVEYAAANATLNGVDAQYILGDCTTYTDSGTYSRVAFNAPDSATAFAFINTTLRDLIDPGGVAQIWFDVEVTVKDGSLENLLRRMIPELGGWRHDTVTNDSSPYSLSRDMIRARRLPQRTLLTEGTERDAYHDALAERGVIEVQSVVLRLRPAH